MKTKINDIEYVFSVRSHDGKFSQSKKKVVGVCKDLDCHYDGKFASVTTGFKPGPVKNVLETSKETVTRLIVGRLEMDPKLFDVKAIAELL